MIKVDTHTCTFKSHVVEHSKLITFYVDGAEIDIIFSHL